MSILEIELTPEMRLCLQDKAKRRGLEEKAYVQTVIMRDEWDKRIVHFNSVSRPVNKINYE